MYHGLRASGVRCLSASEQDRDMITSLPLHRIWCACQALAKQMEKEEKLKFRAKTLLERSPVMLKASIRLCEDWKAWMRR